MTSRFTTRPVLAALLTIALAPPCLAYNPPVDKAGPLTVTIEGPAEVTETGAALPVKVVLENSGDQELAARCGWS